MNEKLSSDCNFRLKLATEGDKTTLSGRESLLFTERWLYVYRLRFE